MGVIEGTYCAKSGHPGGSLSISDLLTYLYFAKMHIDPKQPEMADRDRLVLSRDTVHRHCMQFWHSVVSSHRKNCSLCGTSVPCCRVTRAFIHRALICPAVRSDRAFPLPVVWLWLASWTTLLIRFIPFWAMAKLKKVRFGKQRCLHRIIIWTTCWQS